MKLKATVSDPTSKDTLQERLALATLVRIFNSPLIMHKIYDEVLTPYLRVPGRGNEKAWRAGDAFIQNTDRSCRWDDQIIGIDITMSGVSVTLRRAAADLWTSLDAMLAIYKGLTQNILVKGMKVHLLVRMALDQPIPYLDKPGQTSLIEHDTVWIGGGENKKIESGWYAQATLSPVIEGELSPNIEVTSDMVLRAELAAGLGEATGALLWAKLDTGIRS